jgi:hypothetical protein
MVSRIIRPKTPLTSRFTASFIIQKKQVTTEKDAHLSVHLFEMNSYRAETGILERHFPRCSPSVTQGESIHGMWPGPAVSFILPCPLDVSPQMVFLKRQKAKVAGDALPFSFDNRPMGFIRYSPDAQSR